MKIFAKTLAFVAVAAATLVSCQKETDFAKPLAEGDFVMAIHATSPESVATKTTMSETTPSWLEGDKVRVLYKSAGNDSWKTAESAGLDGDASTATFTTTLDSPDSRDAYAYYPVNSVAPTSTHAKLTISASQTPTGTAFDGASDLLISDAFTPAASVSTRFARLGAVLKVKISNASLSSDKILSLSVTGESSLAGNVLVRLSDKTVTGIEGGSNTVTATYASEKQFTVGAADKYVYLIVYPQTLAKDSELTISGETENATFSQTFTLDETINLNPGHIVPLNVTLASFTPKDRIFLESRFDGNSGTGGNDGQWSGSIATNTTTDATGWTLSNDKGAYQCIKLSSGSGAGSAKTPSITIPSAYSSVKLYFKAGSWSGDGTTMSLSATNAIIKNDSDATVSSVSLSDASWTAYTYNLTSITGNVQITFSSAKSKRFFLDEVVVYYGASVPKKANDLAYAETAVAKTYGDAPFTNTLTNPHSFTISYSSSDTGVATVDSSTGAVAIVKPGTTRITASFAGDSDYASGSVFYDLTVSKAAAGLAYTNDDIKKNIGDANFTNSLTNPHSLSVSYASTDEDVATVDSDGEVTIVGGGTTIISASFTGDDYYLEGEAFYYLTVKKAIKTMSFATATIDVDENDTATLPVLTIKDSDDNDISGDVTVTYTSSNTSIAEEYSGDIYGYAPGHVTLTASVTGDAEYEDKNTTLDVYVLGTLPAPTEVTLTTLNKAALVASWNAALGAESYSWELINTSTSAVAKSGTTTGTSLDIDYSASNVPAGTYKLSVVSTLSSAHAGVNNSSAGESGTKTVISQITASVSIATYASANSWTNESQYTSVTIDSNITASVTSGKTNTGKYYSTNYSWRVYESESAKLTITATTGTIKSITVTYASGKKGVLIYGGANKTSGTEVSINASSAEFSVGHSSGSDKGNVQITNISVTYE